MVPRPVQERAGESKTPPRPTAIHRSCVVMQGSKSKREKNDGSPKAEIRGRGLVARGKEDQVESANGVIGYYDGEIPAVIAWGLTLHRRTKCP